MAVEAEKGELGENVVNGCDCDPGIAVIRNPLADAVRAGVPEFKHCLMNGNSLRRRLQSFGFEAALKLLDGENRFHRVKVRINFCKNRYICENMEKVRCLIIGGGPAGYTAGIYASRAGLSPVIYEGMTPGGQLTTTTVVENFPGFPEGVDANVLMADMRSQAVKFGADIRNGVVSDVDFSSRPFVVKTDGGSEILADAVIVATGATAKYLGLPSEHKFKGLGVSACATCDGFFYRKKVVAVVGGGDTACEEATYLAGLCRKVYMIVRRDVLRASEAMQERVRKTENIEILFNCNTQEILGDASGVSGARLQRKNGEVFDIDIDGFFLAIGHHPDSDIFSRWLETDGNGYIVTHDGQKTSVEGVFAAGDVQDPHYRQAITAAASGCRAALDVKNFLDK